MVIDERMREREKKVKKSIENVHALHIRHSSRMISTEREKKLGHSKKIVSRIKNKTPKSEMGKRLETNLLIYGKSLENHTVRHKLFKYT